MKAFEYGDMPMLMFVLNDPELHLIKCAMWSKYEN